jgi:hypothetical protein
MNLNYHLQCPTSKGIVSKIVCTFATRSLHQKMICTTCEEAKFISLSIFVPTNEVFCHVVLPRDSRILELKSITCPLQTSKRVLWRRQVAPFLLPVNCLLVKSFRTSEPQKHVATLFVKRIGRPRHSIWFPTITNVKLVHQISPYRGLVMTMFPITICHARHLPWNFSRSSASDRSRCL